MATTYAIPDGRVAMAATLYTGTGATQTINNSANGVSFQPDLVWIKSRSNALSHKLVNSVVGIQKALSSDSTAAESSDTGGVTAFNSNGFTIGTTLAYNTSAATFVAWQWNAGGSTVTNTSGSISAQVRANPTAGFSVVTWTSTGANATIGHGLGVAPKMVIVKGRSAISQWFTWHTGLTSGAYALILNLTDAQASYPTVFNSTTPTSSVFSVGTSLPASTTAVAYCFAAVAGYSAFGTYTGNGSTDGPFIYTGFRPRYILIKRTDTTGNWNDFDTSRNTYNGMNNLILLNSSAAETVGGVVLDSVSNGFKLRETSGNWNASGGTYIYACFAENPFKFANAR